MNRDKTAKTLGVTGNTLKNWADHLHCKLPTQFIQADITLLQSYKSLAAQEPRLEPETIIRMLLPLIEDSNMELLETFPFFQVDAEEQEVAGALPGGDGGSTAASSRQVEQGLQQFVADSVEAIVTNMPVEIAANAFIGAINTEKYRYNFKTYFAQKSRALGSPSLAATTVDHPAITAAATTAGGGGALSGGTAGAAEPPLAIAGSIHGENGELIEGPEAQNTPEEKGEG